MEIQGNYKDWGIITGTGEPIEVSCGFSPNTVTLFSDEIGTVSWRQPMPAASYIFNSDMILENGVSTSEGGFSIGACEVNTEGSEIYWFATL